LRKSQGRKKPEDWKGALRAGRECRALEGSHGGLEGRLRLELRTSFWKGAFHAGS